MYCCFLMFRHIGEYIPLDLSYLWHQNGGQNGCHQLALYSKRSRGAGIAQWWEHQTRDWKVGSNPCWSGRRIFFSGVNFLWWLLFQYLFHPPVTTLAHKRSRSFCQKCRWQVTVKYTCTVWYVCGFAWSDMVHGCMVSTEHADMAAVSCGASHASAVSTPLWWIFKNALKKS